MVAGRPAHCLQFNVGESSNHETTTVFVTSWWWWWWWCWCWPWWWIWMLANHHTTKQRQPLPPLVFASEPKLLSTRSLCDFLQPSSALSTEMIGKKCPPLCSQQFYRSSINQGTQIRAAKSVFDQGKGIRFSINPTLHIMHWWKASVTHELFVETLRLDLHWREVPLTLLAS